MPIEAINNLTKDSSPEQIRKAISSCIETEISNGKESDQASAMCYDMARKRTGGKPTLQE